MSSVSSSSKASRVSAKRPSKRLQFDRRYGWVFDEWRDPAEEALAYGRGMFCILPLAKTLVEMASHSINLTATSAVKVVERRDQFSPQMLQAGFSDGFHKFSSSIRGSNSNLFPLKGLSKILFRLHTTPTSRNR
ncbi:hypothetical protein NE237_026980 [Protea cynaroides]|uniref:Uncharacterized protein n=1 Tax=Protea cynaroides TaxID=273540 RepID=A0A9Q0JU00_9MAGN|nr:hypothetical protein NE237_026980 [Protea cynaroides]